MKITNKEMTELEKISYDIASYVTHEHNKHDIRSLREFIENRIQESELNKTNDIHNVSGCIRKDEYGEIHNSKEYGDNACLQCKYKGNTGVEDVCIHCCENNSYNQYYR